MRFKGEEEKGVITFEFLGVICDYNGVDIKQISHYIYMSCETYIKHLTKAYKLGYQSPGRFVWSQQEKGQESK